MIKVVGIGPGSKEYILPIAKKEIENAKILIGGKRALADFSNENQITFPITKDIDGAIEFIKKNTDDVVVMVSGDPGYYSLLDTIIKNFPKDKIIVIPGISSLQVAFARLNLPWHHAKLLSFHGRIPKDDEMIFEENKILGMLTDNLYNSKKIAEVLLNFGWKKNTNFTVFERLSYEDEQVTNTTLEEAKNSAPISCGVIIVYNEV
ncbi:MAG: precorrin-6y C5,15-methyltransferase (decarboxylating) subunit CbiE [Selenomonadaceae bacterium]|nr:precorrin-6y C5,15-methyltransferase (decarboxylating) subunit CbiE [Selenomonadaceae bacterium]